MIMFWIHILFLSNIKNKVVKKYEAFSLLHSLVFGQIELIPLSIGRNILKT
jgi:hypothetical protein